MPNQTTMWIVNQAATGVILADLSPPDWLLTCSSMAPSAFLASDTASSQLPVNCIVGTDWRIWFEVMACSSHRSSSFSSASSASSTDSLMRLTAGTLASSIFFFRSSSASRASYSFRCFGLGPGLRRTLPSISFSPASNNSRSVIFGRFGLS